MILHDKSRSTIGLRYDTITWIARKEHDISDDLATHRRPIEVSIHSGVAGSHQLPDSVYARILI